MTGAGSEIARTTLALGPEAVRRLLDQSSLGAVEIGRPPLDELPYRDLVRTLVGRQGFKLDFNGQTADAVLAMVSDRILGPGAYVAERARLAADISELAEFGAGLVGGAPPSITIRTYFAPGDLVWHVDRLNRGAAFRIVWPIGRAAGMRVTPADNVDARIHRAYMRREHPLLCQMDGRVLRTGASIEKLWAHRPQQLAAMTSGDFPFLLDRDREFEVTPDALSIHRIETSTQPGTYHRSAWANRFAPGLQVVMTAASE